MAALEKIRAKTYTTKAPRNKAFGESHILGLMFDHYLHKFAETSLKESELMLHGNQKAARFFFLNLDM